MQNLARLKSLALSHSEQKLADFSFITEYAKVLSNEMFGEEQWKYLNSVVNMESGWNPYAQNPHSTAYGIFQFLDGTWNSYGCSKTSDYKLQVDCGLRYIQMRYVNPYGALIFHQSHGWY